jgi:hypothetical protein
MRLGQHHAWIVTSDDGSKTMNGLIPSFSLLAAMTIVGTLVSNTSAQTRQPGSEEFGMTTKELVQAVEKVESLIANCMREQGFEYVAADFKTARKGMNADKVLPGMSEEEFAKEYGLGLATFYTGTAPQLSEGYNPGRVGLGERNVQIFKSLSPADQAAYNRALLGEHTDATFAVALEIENFSRCGGCTLKAVKQVFKPEQLKDSYYNPLDALISKDPRMRAALRKYAEAMREAGFDYTHPDEVEPDVRKSLHSITGNGTVPPDQLSPEQLAALKKLQEDERRVAVLTMELEEKLFEPVEEKIEKELFARKVE